MLPFFAVLLVCQLVGESLARLLHLPVPGPVVGLLLLFVALIVWRRPAPGLESTADGLLGHLSLLFVPAGVGVVQYLPLLAGQWLPVTAAVVGGTLATLAATAVTMRLLLPADASTEAAR